MPANASHPSPEGMKLRLIYVEAPRSIVGLWEGEGVPLSAVPNPCSLEFKLSLVGSDVFGLPVQANPAKSSQVKVSPASLENKIIFS